VEHGIPSLNEGIAPSQLDPQDNESVSEQPPADVATTPRSKVTTQSGTRTLTILERSSSRAPRAASKWR